MSEDEAQPSEESVTAEETAADDTPVEAAEAAEAASPPEEAAEAPSEAAPETSEEIPIAASSEASEEGSDAAAEGEEPDASDGPVVSEVVEVGAVVQGTVQRTTPYGAFIQLPGGKLGLIHISEIDRNYVKDVTEHVREGDAVKAKVLAIKEDGKIDLSIKALQDPAPRVQRRGSDPGFEQMLRKFMRQSEERQVDVKRSVMNKRK